MTVENVYRVAAQASTWFGPLSLIAAAASLSINLFPIAIAPVSGLLLSVFYVAELAMAATLWPPGGRVRQVASGFAVAVTGTFLCLIAAGILGVR